MSLKDDFLEALSSVKNDIFNASADDTESSETGAAKSSADDDLSYFKSDTIAPTAPLYSADGAEESADTDNTDESEVYDAFKMATTLDSSAFEDVDETLNDDSVGGVHNSESSADAAYVSALSSDEIAERDNFNNNFEFYDDTDSPTADSEVSEVATDDDYSDGLALQEDAGTEMNDFGRADLYSDDKTVISKNTIIRGAITTDDSVRLLGQVHGDIDCKSNIVVAGKVRGNTSAANAYIMDAQIDGSLQCDDVVSVSSDAWVLGDIRAQQAEIDGKIKGNLDIRHAISIGSSSSIIGNISTDELEIKRGAFVNGQIMMYTPSRDVLDRFDQFEK